MQSGKITWGNCLIFGSRGPIFNRDISVLISNYYQHVFDCHELLIITEGVVGTEANFYFRKEETREIDRQKRLFPPPLSPQPPPPPAPLTRTLSLSQSLSFFSLSCRTYAIQKR